tara:strand:+ start:359 stop:1954 length:1596 start_codon:yes stop_codon:yes gene_type:complete
MFDIILKNGQIFDGDGKTPITTDLGIKDNIISEIGKIESDKGKDVINVDGLAVSPGFVDMHTHSDFTLMVNGRAESQVHQGVTTEVVGQCGISCAPVNSDKDIKQMAIGYCENSHKLGWRSFKDYLTSLEKNKLGVNVAAFVGHGAVHNNVLGNELRAPNNDEIIKMCKIIEESLDEGAAGFSSGLEYWPGNLATSQDLVSMCEKVAKKNKIYATHVRNRDNHYDLGFTEALTTARQSGVKLQISHIQPKYGAPEYAVEHTLKMIETFRKLGVDVAFDIIPHTWNHTRILSILPQWAQEGGASSVIDRLKNMDARKKIRNNPQPMWLLVRDNKWDDIVLIHSNKNSNLIGMTFTEIGRSRGVDPYDAAFDLLIEEGEEMGSLLWSSKAFREDDIIMCLQQPECAVISDTTALAPYGALKNNIGSISGYGWAARFFQDYVNDKKILSLTEAIRRITSLPAERLGLIKRGKLKKSFYADVCVFDPQKIKNNCDLKNLKTYPSGIEYVIVNGVFAVKKGNRTKFDGGQVLRKFN